MKYIPPYGSVDPNASYTNGNAVAGTPGSIPDARAIEHPMREIIEVIEAAGLTPSEGDLTQLKGAIEALISTNVPSASAAAQGKVELATNAEVQAGSDTVRAVTPAGLASRTATETRTGLVELATNAEVQAGSDTERAITPAGLASRTATETRTGLVELATNAEVQAGTDTERAVTPAGLLSAFLRSGTSPGYIKLPTGLILQWGVTSWAGGQSSASVTFPVAFLNAVYGAFANYYGIAHTNNLNSACSVIATPTVTGMTVGSNINNAGSGAQAAFWLAIGN